MKAVKIIIVLLALAAVAFAVTYQLRDRIIQRLSGPYLREYGIELTDVSLDALSTSDATIRFLEFRHDSGATVTIRDLRLPLRAVANADRSFAAREVTISRPPDGNGKPAALAERVRQLVSLPGQLPNTAVTIAKLNIPPYQAVENLEWRLLEQNQSLSATIASTDLHVVVAREGEQRHTAAVTVGDRFLTLSIAEQEAAVSLQGAVTLQLPSALRLARYFKELLPSVQIESGTVALDFHATLPDDPALAESISLDITPSTPLKVVHTGPSDDVTRVEMAPENPLSVELELANMGWSLAQEQASLRISTGPWRNLPVTLRNIACRSDLECEWDLEVAAGGTGLGPASAASLRFSAAQRLALRDDLLQVKFDPGAALTLDGLSHPDLSAARLSATLATGALIESNAAGWQLSAGKVEVNISALELAGYLVAELPMSFDSVSAGQGGGRMTADLSLGSTTPALRWRQHDVPLPEFAGSVSLENDELRIRLSPAGHANPDQPLVSLSHALDTESGQLVIRDASLDFAGRKLSERLLPWPYDWDIAGGRLTANLQLSWQRTDGEFEIAASPSIELSQLAGAYEDNAFAGLSTSLQAVFTTEGGLVPAPARISVRLLDVGLPIENIGAAYELDPDTRTVQVEQLTMQAFGGVIKAQPFSFDSAADSNDLILEAESIELTELLTLKEFEQIELSGSIGAHLPVTIAGKSVTISGGKLTGEEAGGVIRYLPGLQVDDSSVSSIGLVTRALSNFEYETLESDVDYGKDGDLKLQMRLTGRNPDIEGGRPVVLNLGVENNVPAMLKSLQAARSVEEILERKIGK